MSPFIYTKMTISDIVAKARFYTNTNTTNYPAADMLIAVNNAYERVASLIMQADGRWEWDDANNTDFPIATTALTADQGDYGLAVTHLKILRVEVKDENGLWTQLYNIDQSDYKGQAQGEFLKTAGQPVYYDLVNSSVILYPKPDYSQAASLKIYFQRGPAVFTSAEVTTGTKVPGFNSLYHELIPLHAAHDYAIAKGSGNVNQLAAQIQIREEALQSDYEMRNKDERLVLRVKHTSSR